MQQVRRELVVHASVRGGHADIPTMLATMSIIKTSNASATTPSNLLRLARVRGPFAPDTAEHVELTAYGNRIAGHVTDVRDALATHDGPAATALIIDLRALIDDLHTAVHQLLVADIGVSDWAAQALSFHYLARIAAHLSNILTSIVMPLDKLDYYDGSHETTGSP